MRAIMSEVEAYESGHLSHERTVRMFQKAINDGSVWVLQGAYGRQAMALIESGDCILGMRGFRDAYGNYIPSRYEVKKGTKGSIAYAKKMRAERGV